MADLSNLSGLLKEIAPKYYVHSIASNSALISSGVLKTKKDKSVKEWTILHDKGNTPSPTFALDNDARAPAYSTEPSEGKALPATLNSRIRLGEAMAQGEMSDGEIETLLDFHLQREADSLARTLARGIHGGYTLPAAAADQSGAAFPAWSAATPNATLTCAFYDISLFRENMAVDVADDSANVSHRVRVSAITPGAVGSYSAYVAGTVEFTHDVLDSDGTAPANLSSAFTIAATDKFALPGYYTPSDDGAGTDTKRSQLVGFDDITGTGASASLYNISGNGWEGNYTNHGGAYTQEGVAGFVQYVKTRSGLAPDVAVMHPQMVLKHMSTTFGAGTPMQLDNTVNKYGQGINDDINKGKTGLRVASAAIFEDDNSPATLVTLFNSKKTWLWENQPIAPTPGPNGEMWHTDHDYLSILIFMRGRYQLVTEKRRSCGILYGITGL